MLTTISGLDSETVFSQLMNSACIARAGRARAGVCRAQGLQPWS
jgi:hypothetical protein